MADEQIDTLTPPDAGPGGEADSGSQTEGQVFYTSTGEPLNAEPPETGPETPPELPPEPPPRQYTLEEMRDQLRQDFQTWTGRREAELLYKVGEIVRANQAPIPQPLPPPRTDPATILENPDVWATQLLNEQVPRILDRVVTQRTQAEQNYNAELIRQAAQKMDTDPLFADQDFGNAVVAEIQKNFGAINKNLHPQVAAELLVSNAALAVTRARMAGKPNALAGNRPNAGGIGTVTPPPGRSPNIPPPIKLDPMAKKVADWFGNTEKDIQDMLK